MQKALGKKDTRVAHGKLAYSYFVDLADKKLRNGGRMGMILPTTVLSVDSFKKVREMWATEYHDVVVVTIAQRDAHDSAFFSRHRHDRMHGCRDERCRRKYGPR